MRTLRRAFWIVGETISAILLWLAMVLALIVAGFVALFELPGYIRAVSK